MDIKFNDIRRRHAKCNFVQKTKYHFASKSLFAEQITIHVRLGEGYLVAPHLLLNLTGPFKAARPVITRWRKGTVQCLHVAHDDR